MKLKYVVPLEILGIMVSASQIFDTRITFKSVLEVLKSRKTLTRNHNGSLIFLYEVKALVKGVTKLHSEFQMGKNRLCCDRFKRDDGGEFLGSEFVYICVYQFLKRDETKKIK